MSELRSLLAIKSAGNLTRAALDLKVTQPALSQQLREVEDKLDVPLFVRHRRGLDPTPAGVVMLRLASAMGVDLHIAAEELALVSSDDTRPIRIGSMAVTSAGLLAVALGRFVQQSPGVNVVVMEGPREVLLEHLRHRRIDLFIGRLPDEESVRDLDSETLFLDGAVVVASARHPLRKKTRLSLESIQALPWILPAEDTSFYQQIVQSLRTKGLPVPAARIHSYSMLAIPAVIATSEMVGFLPTSMFASGAMSAGLQRLAVDLDWIASPVGVLTHRDRSEKERLSGVLNLLRSVAASARNAVSLS
jgi:LysR family transcriptional regulator, regulator for genes of the gallate degradation pathway